MEELPTPAQYRFRSHSTAMPLPRMSIPDQLISAVNFLGEDANGNAHHSSGSIEFHLIEQLDRSDS